MHKIIFFMHFERHIFKAHIFFSPQNLNKFSVSPVNLGRVGLPYTGIFYLASARFLGRDGFCKIKFVCCHSCNIPVKFG